MSKELVISLKPSNILKYLATGGYAVTWFVLGTRLTKYLYAVSQNRPIGHISEMDAIDGILLLCILYWWVSIPLALLSGAGLIYWWTRK